MYKPTRRGGPGDFNWSTLVSNYKFELPQVVDTSSRYGLVRDGQYIYGLLRDDSGNAFGVIRKFELDQHSWWFILQTNEGANAIRLDRAAAAPAFRGGFNIEVEGNEAVYRPNTILAGAGKRSNVTVSMNLFEFAIGPDGVRWREDGAIDLRGIPVGPGMQWFTPYEGGAAHYLSVGHKVEGTIKGRRVRGFLFFDQFYLPPGMSWTHDPFVRDVEVRWHTYGNWYEDGTVELGHICVGHENWGFFFNNSTDGTVRATSNVDSVIVERDEQGLYPRRIETVVDGTDRWLWIADENGTMGDYDRPDNPNSNGCELRVGDKRVPLIWMAWGETCPKHGDRRRH